MPDFEDDPPTSEELQIMAGLAEAEMNGHVIDDWEAARIAARFHDGQASALYSFTSTGTVSTSRCFTELMATTVDGFRSEQDLHWIRALGEYIVTHDRQKPVRHWSILTRDSAAPYLGRIAYQVEVDSYTQD